MQPNTPYVIVLYADSGDSSNYIQKSYDIDTVTHPGIYNDIYSSSWRYLTGYDSAFYVYEIVLPSTNIKSVAGVAYANIKKIEGAAIANVKKVAGVG